MLAGAVVLLLLAAAGAGVALFQWDRADDNAAAAAASEIRAVARRAGASALVTGNVDTSLLLAVAGTRLDPGTGTANSLLAAIGKRPELFASTPIEGDLPLGIDASADGKYVAILDESHHLRLYDASTGGLVGDRQEGAPLVTLGAQVGRQVEFSPDGRWLAVSWTPDSGQALELLSVPTLEPAATLRGLPGRGWQVTDLSFSGDASHFAAGLQRTADVDASQIRGAALVWDLHSGAAPRRFRFIGKVVPQVALDERGEVLFTSQPLTRRSVATGASRVLVPHDWFWSLAVLPDGDVLGIDGNTPTRVDGSSGRVLARYPSDGSFLMSLRVRPDGRRFMVISSDEREVREWKVVDAKEPRGTFSLDRGNANAVDYSADGTFVYASGTGWHRPAPLGPHRGEGLRVDRADVLRLERPVRGDGRRRPAIRGAGRRRMGPVRLPHGQVGVIPGPGGFRHTYGAFHPDGQHFATAAGTRVEVWDGAGEPTGQQAVFPSGKLTELDYTPDGSRLAVAELDGTITLLDGDSLERVGTPVAMGAARVAGSSHARTGARLWCSSAASRPPAASCSRAAAGPWSTWSTGSWCDEGRWR